MASANTRIIDITVGELLEMLNKHQEQNKPSAETPNQPTGERKYVYGIAGMAELFNCSKTTANTIKQSGKIDKAIRQVGRKIIIDARLALDLAGKTK